MHAYVIRVILDQHFLMAGSRVFVELKRCFRFTRKQCFQNTISSWNFLFNHTKQRTDNRERTRNLKLNLKMFNYRIARSDVKKNQKKRIDYFVFPIFVSMF